MDDDRRCETCASMRQLGHERGGRIAYTVSFWCERHGRHTSPRKSCAEWAGRGEAKSNNPTNPTN